MTSLIGVWPGLFCKEFVTAASRYHIVVLCKDERLDMVMLNGRVNLSIDACPFKALSMLGFINELRDRTLVRCMRNGHLEAVVISYKRNEGNDGGLQTRLYILGSSIQAGGML